MTKAKLIDYIQEEYGVNFDNPFKDDFVSAVFRHKSNKKWFALLMNIPKIKLTGKDETRVDALNVKVDPILREAILKNKGIYIAYHMNKNHWVTILLDEASDNDIFALVDLSYKLTEKN